MDVSFLQVVIVILLSDAQTIYVGEELDSFPQPETLHRSKEKHHVEQK